MFGGSTPRTVTRKVTRAPGGCRETCDYLSGEPNKFLDAICAIKYATAIAKPNFSSGPMLFPPNKRVNIYSN